MNKSSIKITRSGRKTSIPATWVHTLVIGSGAAGLNAAARLRREGIEDVLIVTEGLEKGTSINTGSDKQTYYKLAMCGNDADSPAAMAETYFAGGSMHGDIALVEAGLSTRAFMNLVNMGVPFPTDEYGQFAGYKTDHDPRQRATSIGPYTSREMCRALIRQVKSLNIAVREQCHVVQLLTDPSPDKGAASSRVIGAVTCDNSGDLEVMGAANVVLAVGGPGGLYKTSVYPEVHTGGIGLALLAGATAQSLPESQYGLASVKFRWNVSGTYMQAIPRFISTAPDGTGDAREFLPDYFADSGEMNSRVFLKGYQWPFDSRKAAGGSSLIDILVNIETVVKGRRVFMDFRSNPAGFGFDTLAPEARDYLAKSKAMQDTPLARLQAMNPDAVSLYREHGIDIAREPLEIAVCAQHNNGGLAANLWWESVNIKRLFPVGEVNGSHGVYRPGGSALNSGQVGGFRAAEYIAHRYRDNTADQPAVEKAACSAVVSILDWLDACAAAPVDWRTDRAEFQDRMSRTGAHIRSLEELDKAVPESWAQWRRINTYGCRIGKSGEKADALKTRYLCFAHAVYLEAVRFQLASGTGSRGSAITLDPAGTRLHSRLDGKWSIQPENPAFREQVLETSASPDGKVVSRWVPRRPLPVTETWFETAWARHRNGGIY